MHDECGPEYAEWTHDGNDVKVTADQLQDQTNQRDKSHDEVKSKPHNNSLQGSHHETNIMGTFFIVTAATNRFNLGPPFSPTR